MNNGGQLAVCVPSGGFQASELPYIGGIVLQQNVFGTRIEGQSSGTATTTPPGLNLLRLEESLSAAHLRLASTCIEHLPWHDGITRHDRAHTSKTLANGLPGIITFPQITLRDVRTENQGNAF